MSCYGVTFPRKVLVTAEGLNWESPCPFRTATATLPDLTSASHSGHRIPQRLPGHQAQSCVKVRVNAVPLPRTPFPLATKTDSGVTADTWPHGQSRPLWSFGVCRHTSSPRLRSLCMSGPRKSETVPSKVLQTAMIGQSPACLPFLQIKFYWDTILPYFLPLPSQHRGKVLAMGTLHQRRPHLGPSQKMFVNAWPGARGQTPRRTGETWS